MAKDFAKRWQAGKDSALRKNRSGCCCKFDEDDMEVVALCAAHVEVFENIIRNQKDLPPKISALIDKHFWELS